MSTISQTTTILANSMAWALIHSLWQGLLLFALLFVLLKTVPGFSTRLKYYLSYGAFTALFVWFGETWVSQFERLKGMFELNYGSMDVAPMQIIISDIKTVSEPVALVSAPSFSSQLLHFIEQNVPVIMTIYIAGLAFMLLRFVINIYSLRALRTQGISEPDNQWNKLVEVWRRRFTISRPVKLFLSAKINVPIMLGTLKPVILLPIATINHLTSGQLEAILLHELAHIKRQDYLLNMLQTAGETILFFNPFVWLISRIIRQQREDCCDDLVVANTASPLQYAQALAILEQGRSNDQQLALAATGNRKHLLNRIKRIMVMKKDSPGYGQLSILLLSFITLAFIGAMCTFTTSIAQRTRGDMSDTTKKKMVIENNQISIDSGRNKPPVLIESKPVESVKVFGSKEEMKWIDDSITEEQRFWDALGNQDTTSISFFTKDSILVFAKLFDDPLKINRIFKRIQTVLSHAPFEYDNEIMREALTSELRKAYKNIINPELDMLIDKQVDKYIAKNIKQNETVRIKKVNMNFKRPDNDSTKISSANKDSAIESNPLLIAAKEMEADGLLHFSHFLIELLHGELYIDNVKQPKEITDKYAKYFQKNSSVEHWDGVKTKSWKKDEK